MGGGSFVAGQFFGCGVPGHSVLGCGVFGCGVEVRESRVRRQKFRHRGLRAGWTEGRVELKAEETRGEGKDGNSNDF